MGLWDASELILTNRETGATHSLSSVQGVRQGDPLGPLMFSLGIRALLDDLATTLGPQRLILAYLDVIYILSNDPSALEDVQAFFSARQPSIQTNMANSKTTALQVARERGMQLLGSCIGPTAARERFLEAKIAAEEALLANWSTCLTSTRCWSSDSVYSRICDTCSVPCAQMTWNTFGNDWTRPWPIPCAGSAPQRPRHRP
jgi:hypothetical protein